VLPGSGGGVATSLADAARRRGLLTVRAEDLRARLFARKPRTATVPAAAARPGLEEIERESASLQAAIDDLEDALAGDTILRRLLELCRRAVGASGGSIMLFDEASRELYIAYAVGLSEGTLHSTRVALGEGIAGRVARTGKAELVTGQKSTPSRRRDRPDIATAICTPLMAGERLLGVLNVSTGSGQPPLDADDRDLLVNLAVRLARILDGVQQLQRQRTSRMFDLTEQQLRRLATLHSPLPERLAAWAEALAVTAEAARVSLAIPCADGSLLVCEGAPGEPPEHWYESLHNPAWLEVLGSGAPLVAREEVPPAPDDGPPVAPVTVFYLPIGRDPVRAGLSVQFATTGNAHAFHGMAGEAAFLVERLLLDQLEQHRQADRSQRLAALSEVTTELAAHDGTFGQYGERVCEAAAELVGARHVAGVGEIAVMQPRLVGGNAPQDAPWLEEIPRLLEAMGEDCWRITTLETASGPVSVLIVAADASLHLPALVLVDKQRTHDLDGRVFTPLDAELVSPLAGLLGRALGPALAEISTLPLGAEMDTARAGTRVSYDDDGEARLLEDLARELDRCDRYHNVCGLVLLRPDLPVDEARKLLQAARRRVTTGLRASDRLYCLPTGEMAVIAPEDVQHLDRLQARLVKDLAASCGEDAPAIDAARTAYPAAKGPAEALLARVRERLAPADPGSAAAR